MTRPQVCLLRRIEDRARILSLLGSHGSELVLSHRVFEVCSRSANIEMVRAQVLLFRLVQLGTELPCVALVIELHVRF